MQLSPDQQQAIEQQKAQCIFCQIIEGKVPSKKVYEDDLIIGILDINPAAKGHVLLMPKEHYPIMPLIPPDTFKRLVDRINDVDRCVKDALLCKETTVFVANGGAAGQQSSHFMLHIIPREGGDGLNMLEVPSNELPEDELKEVMERAGGHLEAALIRNLPALGFKTGKAAASSSGMPAKVSKEQLLKIIDANPNLKDIMLNKTDQFKQLVPNNPQLAQLFKEFDIDEIVEAMRKKSQPAKQKEPGKLNLDEVLK